LDEIGKIRLKYEALVKARDYLRNQTTPDQGAIQNLNANLFELRGRQAAATQMKQIPVVAAEEERQLTLAIQALNQSIDAKASAADILDRAKTAFNLSPWPPQDYEGAPPDNKQKPEPVVRPRMKATIGKYYAVDTSEGKSGTAPNILFYLVPQTSAPDEYSALQIDIEHTLTVLKVLFFPKQTVRFEEYFSRLSDLARASLGQDQVRLGRLALLALQSEIVSREAGPVKNGYIRRLGRWALLFGVIATAAYLYCRYGDTRAVPELHRFREFLSMLAGSFLGTWLSFSIRRVELSFDDLARLEQDLLDPSIRLLFVAGLTVVVGLLLATKAVVITFGGFNSAFLDSGLAAVLIGCLCGIGEMGLPTAVGQRASEFVAVLGGARGSTTQAGSTASKGGAPGTAAADTHVDESGTQPKEPDKPKEVKTTAAADPQ